VSDNIGESDTHFLNHPETTQLFASVFSTLVEESDRGAVLIGTAHVDLHLKKLFQTIAPQSMSRRELARVLEYPGSLSSLSGKADLAYLTRLIPESLHEAINHLRGIRNDVAHHPDSFRLAEHEQQLRRMYELGPGVPAAINRWAGDAIIYTAVKNILGVKDPVSEEVAFANPQEALDYLAESPEIITALDERRPRYELALGVVLICGMIVFYRERAKEVLGENMVLATLRRQRNPPQEPRET
jgi:hypothetical protein